jgi:predicted acyl esterase
LSPPKSSFVPKLDSQLAVTMSDGVELKADVSYPTDPATGERAPGPFPVLLTQSPYKSTDPKAGDYFVQHGYIYVTAYVRGTTTSGGSFGFFSDRDAQDGAELVDWAAHRLPGSNGTVGLHGGSYAGINQMFTTVAAGPGSPIKAMLAACMGAEFYRETYFAGGIPTQTLNFQRVIGDAMGGDTAAAGAANVADIEAGGDKAYFRDFWKQRTAGELAQKIVDTGVPTMLWSSDGDIYAQSSLDLYAYFQNAYAKAPVYGPMSAATPTTGRYQIIMSQGGHCQNEDPNIQLEWFDTWLKGAPTGMDKTSTPIHVHEMISNRWINTSHYPVTPTYTSYYLGASNELGTEAPLTEQQKTLAWAAPDGNSTATFDGPVLAEGATLAGPISATIYASSSAADLELLATVQSVASDGQVTTVSSGTVLGSMSELDPARSWSDTAGVPVRPYGKYDKSTPLTPGSVNRFDFAISPRFVTVPPGSTIRVVFSTQSSADCSPPLGTDPCFPTNPQRAELTGSTVTIHSGATTPSSIHLPLLEAGCWRPAGDSAVPSWGNEPAPPAQSAPCQQ